MSGANAAGMVTVQYEVPSRGMNGVKTKLLSATKGRAARRNGPLRPLEGHCPVRPPGGSEGSGRCYATRSAA